MEQGGTGQLEPDVAVSNPRWEQPGSCARHSRDERSHLQPCVFCPVDGPRLHDVRLRHLRLRGNGTICDNPKTLGRQYLFQPARHPRVRGVRKHYSACRDCRQQLRRARGHQPRLFRVRDVRCHQQLIFWLRHLVFSRILDSRSCRRINLLVELPLKLFGIPALVHH